MNFHVSIDHVIYDKYSAQQDVKQTKPCIIDKQSPWWRHIIYESLSHAVYLIFKALVWLTTHRKTILKACKQPLFA